MAREKDVQTLTDIEVRSLAQILKNGRGHLNFTNLANKQAVKREATKLGVKTTSHTVHGSLLDPRYTVEGSHLPDKGFGNDYKHYTPRLYCLETDNYNRY